MKRFVTYALFMVLSAVSCREKIDVPVADEIAFSAPEVAETKSILITDKTEMVSGAVVITVHFHIIHKQAVLTHAPVLVRNIS